MSRPTARWTMRHLIHVLSFDNHRADVVFGLLGKRQSLLWQSCNLHIRAVGSTGTLDRNAHGTHVLHGNRVSASLGIIVFSDADRVARCTRRVAGEGVGGLSRDAGYDDLIDLSCRAVATVVVQIEIDVVFILADESTGELSQVSFSVSQVLYCKGMSADAVFLLFR